MPVSSAERRRASRLPDSHPATIYAQDGRLLAAGRLGNASDRGAFVVARMTDEEPASRQQVVLELTVPELTVGAARPAPTRNVRLNANIIRTVRLGPVVGIGIEFLLSPS